MSLGSFGACVICGRPTRKPGELLCTFHDIQALIELSAERMRDRLKLQCLRYERVHPRARLQANKTTIPRKDI